MGIPTIYGKDPKAPRKGQEEPDNAALLYIHFGTDGRMTARHAYFTREEGSDAAKIECLIPWLRKGPKGTNPCKAFVNPGTRTDGEAYQEDFFEFDFASRHILYVYIDNKDVAFNAVTPVSFTPYGANDKVTVGMSPTRHENCSWNGASVGSLGGSPKYQGLTIYNDFLDAKGRPCNHDDWEDANYAMNFHLRACTVQNPKCDVSSHEQTIAIVIDPDTNNGQGGRP